MEHYLLMVSILMEVSMVVTARFTLLSLIVVLLNGSSEAALKVGDKAPDFSLPCATKDSIIESLTLSDVIGKNNVILAFYPADWSGGCTVEMCTMRDNFGLLSELGGVVLGISGDYVYSHREWAKHHNLQFALLADHDHAVAKQYSSYNGESGYNQRTIYVIDKSGTIAYIDPAYKVREPASFENLKAALTRLK
jgi:peroxiredoxin Q/BCP